MQRKNDLLTTLKSILNSREHFSVKNIPYAQFKGTQAKRSGFAMVTAVIVMIVIATIMGLTLSQTTQTAKRTADIYLYEQTELYAKSAIEYALFKIAEGGPCTTITPFTLDGIYNITIDLGYVYKNLSCGADDYITTITTDEQNGSVLMDVTVSVDANETGSDPIRYFRRTIQKL